MTAHLDKQDVPDLSMLPPEQLLRIIEQAKEMTGPITIELPERGEGNGHHRGGPDESPPP